MRLLASPSVGLAILVGLAAPARAAPITFIATSDTQWSETDSANDAKRTILATMNTIAGDTFPLAVGGATIGTPRGVLLAGDLTNGGSTKAVTAQWSYWTRDFGLTGSDGAVLNLPVYETWGNRDANSIVQSSIVARNQSRVGVTAVPTPSSLSGRLHDLQSEPLSPIGDTGHRRLHSDRLLPSSPIGDFDPQR